jgi:DNA mismatch repair protein MutS
MAKKITPLMQQYQGIKTKYPDALLLFRVGDFYETFGSDAVRAAEILNITLTARNNGGDQTELAGFPHHALNTYLPKLVMAGCRVAICDQLEDPKQTKTIVKRGVTELVTPGVAFNDDILQRKSNNFLAAVSGDQNLSGVSFLDISTGEFLVAQGDGSYIQALLQKFNPAEVLWHKKERLRIQKSSSAQGHAFFLEDWVFQKSYADDLLLGHFKTKSLKGFGVETLEFGLIAAGAILHYISTTQHRDLSHITRITRIAQDQYVWMDHFTMRNLELFGGSGSAQATLFGVMDQTISPMGGRLLKRWLALPLKNIDQIKARHEVVAYWHQNAELRNALRQALKGVGDLERLISKTATGKINPKEVRYLADSLTAAVPIVQAAQEADQKALNDLGGRMDLCPDLVDLIYTQLQEQVPALLSKGSVMASGVSSELDDLRSIASGGKTHLEGMLQRHQEETGITSLKIDSNNVFGYYIEVRNSHKDKVPEHWIRKQTLVNAERYITEELKTYEAKIFGAEERIAALEYELFTELVQKILPYIGAVQKTAAALAEMDCLMGFAELAVKNNYVCPELNDSFALDIKQGRHPVIERQLAEDNPYIANDVFLDRDQQQIIMITGPNMSGKSALLRQTALIVIMAQMGCFVPAQAVTMGVVDKIFTRVGASDNIAQGESTFMVEMNETASILNNVSQRSLILLDEIGRGTSTYDGISIAWAISEYLHEHPSRAKTLFATHYHELNEMTQTFPRIKNFNVSIKELDDTVLFLRTLVQGGSEHSFGIHVAKMAGMPGAVIQRSEAILKQLESSRSSSDNAASAATSAAESMQLSFIQLDDPLLEDIKQKILNTDIDNLTPMAALMTLNDIKKLLLGASDKKAKK